MAKRKKCRCRELRSQVEWYQGRAAIMKGVLRRLVDLEDERRRVEREYQRAVIDARGVLHLEAGEVER